MAPAPFINPALADLARREDTLIVFPHAQRTGGKTLRDEVLSAVYGADRVYSASRGTGTKAWKDVAKADLDGFRVYTGPSNFADLDKGRPTVFLGLVRHPLYRAISLYHYCRKGTWHKLHPIANRTTLEQFYAEASKINPPYFHNTQCLRMSGAADVRKVQKAVGRKYLGVGFTEEIGTFSGALGSVLGWPQIDVETAQTDDKRYAQQGSPEFRNRVLKESAEDLKMYEWLAAGAPAPVRRTFFSGLGAALTPGHKNVTLGK